MKIIDLLNKIAKGEEVPKKIRIGEIVFEKNTEAPNIDYCLEKGNTFLFQEYIHAFGEIGLNDELEIIEEDKKIEKLSFMDIAISINETYNDNVGVLMAKINELIDVVNKLNKE